MKNKMKSEILDSINNIDFGKILRESFSKEVVIKKRGCSLFQPREHFSNHNLYLIELMAEDNKSINTFKFILQCISP